MRIKPRPQSELSGSPPRQQTAAFLEALKEIIIRDNIDLLIPTCEEVFYVGMGRSCLPCKVFAESIEKLQTLHNKWSFALRASELGLSVPETFLVRTPDELLLAFTQWRKLILKPVYSRFATRTLIEPTIKQALSTMTFDFANQWVAQELIAGREICTYSVVQHGRLTAHAAYRADFTAGRGATIVFQPITHQATFDWVQRFVAAIGFTGQIAFDFIETPDGEVNALDAIRAPQVGFTCSLHSRNSQVLSSTIIALSDAFEERVCDAFNRHACVRSGCILEKTTVRPVASGLLCQPRCNL